MSLALLLKFLMTLDFFTANLLQNELGVFIYTLYIWTTVPANCVVCKQKMYLLQSIGHLVWTKILRTKNKRTTANAVNTLKRTNEWQTFYF